MVADTHRSALQRGVSDSFDYTLFYSALCEGYLVDSDFRPSGIFQPSSYVHDWFERASSEYIQ